MRIFATVISCVALLLCGAGVAQAQDDDDGLLCVYEDLVLAGHAEIVAEAYLYDAAAANFDEAQTAVVDIAKDCADTYNLSDGALSAVIDMGVYGVTADYLGDELTASGVSEEAIAGIFDLYASLDEDDLDRFATSDWRDDAAFLARLVTGLEELGFESGEEESELALQVIEVSALADQVILKFMFAAPDDPERAEP